MVPIALAFAVLELGGSATEVGIVLACRILPQVATLLFGGVVADRVSRRVVMVVADLLRSLTQGAIAALLIAGVAEIWMLAVLAGLTGAAGGFFNPAATGLMPRSCRASCSSRPTVCVRPRSRAARSPAGARGCADRGVGPGWALAVDAATFALSAAFLAGLRLPARGACARRRPSSLTCARAGPCSLADLGLGVRGRRRVGEPGLGPWTVLGPVIAHRSLGGPAAWGSVLGALGVGALSAALALRAPAAAAGGGLAHLRAVRVSARPARRGRAGRPDRVGGLLGGVAMMLANALWEATLHAPVPEEALSRVSAYDWFGSLAF